MFKIYRLWTLLPEADPLPPGSDSPSPGVGTWWFVLHTTCSRSKSTPAGTVGRSEHRCCPSHSQFLGYEMFKHPRLQGTEYILRLDQASVEEKRKPSHPRGSALTEQRVPPPQPLPPECWCKGAWAGRRHHAGPPSGGRPLLGHAAAECDGGPRWPSGRGWWQQWRECWQPPAMLSVAHWRELLSSIL